MAKFWITQNESHIMVYEVEAATAAAAEQLFFDGEVAEVVVKDDIDATVHVKTEAAPQ